MEDQPAVTTQFCEEVFAVAVSGNKLVSSCLRLEVLWGYVAQDICGTYLHTVYALAQSSAIQILSKYLYIWQFGHILSLLPTLLLV
jgi:hypothetical protein